jgi:hypothetical protein
MGPPIPGFGLSLAVAGAPSCQLRLVVGALICLSRCAPCAVQAGRLAVLVVIVVVHAAFPACPLPVRVRPCLRRVGALPTLSPTGALLLG